MLKQTGDLSGKVIVSCSLPMNAANTGHLIAHTSSGAEELAKKVPEARIVSAFHTLPSEVLFSVFEGAGFSVFEGAGGATRPSLVYSGDGTTAKAVAAELIRDAGFDPVDSGSLRMARYTEPFALLVGHLAYDAEGGPELAYKFERFGRYAPP